VLSLSIKTVERHRQTLMDKLKIHKISTLTRYAVSNGVIESNRIPRLALRPAVRAPQAGTGCVSAHGKLYLLKGVKRCFLQACNLHCRALLFHAICILAAPG